MNLFLILQLLISLAVLTAAAELLVRFASKLALQLGVSPLFVGLTVIGFGTSSPELASSITATVQGAPGISVGNVVGSNILNIGVILALTAVLKPIPVSYDRLRFDMFVAIGAISIPVAAYFAGTGSERIVGIAAVSALVAYLYRVYRRDKNESAEAEAHMAEEVESALILKPTARSAAISFVTSVAIIAGSLALLVFSAAQFVDSAAGIARIFGVSERIIGLTIVAAGTSMPELVTSIVAARRNAPDMVVGNVIGSNIFNLLCVFGVASIVGPQSIQTQTLYIDIPVMLVLSILLLPVIKSGSIVSRGEGALLLSVYVGYTIVLMVFGGGG